MYFIDNKTILFNNLNNIKKYIDINLVHSSTKNKDTKYMGQLISSQQKNFFFKKGEMKNDETRKIWNDFICDDKYKKYFKINT